MKVLLAGPGTGKTCKVKDLIKENYTDSKKILVLSFTNATVNDLKSSFKDWDNVSCYTLHSYALLINHLKDSHVLESMMEVPILEKMSADIEIDFDTLCLLLKCITFDDMVKKCTRFIRANPAYAAENIGLLDLLIVDEFQDFNSNERDLIYLLSEYSKETLILGDDDQSIYEFKDADPLGIINLYNQKDILKITPDNICHRCPDVIIDYCTKLIKKNRNRIDKPWNKSNKKGDMIFKQILSQIDTNKYICNMIKKIREQDTDGSILILSPVGYYVESLKNELENQGFEYVDFWYKSLSYELFRSICWLRAIYTERKILNLIFLSKELSPHFKKKFKNDLKSSLEKDFNKEELLNKVTSYFPSPFCDYITNPPDIDDLLNNHKEFEELSDYINKAELVESINNLIKNSRPAVEFIKGSINIMSIHKSKGLQAEYVFITGLVDGVLPNKIKGIDTIEAQRRLLYVGMTRTIKILFIISTVEWDSMYVHKLDKSQFKYDYRKKIYRGKTSLFVEDMKN